MLGWLRMNIGLYQSASALRSLERWQEAVAQNITSSQVTGFRRRAVQVSAEGSGEILPGGASAPDRGQGTVTLFPQTRYAIVQQPGETNPTRRDLDLAISGEGFFTVRMPDETLAYTRAGDFGLNADRVLVNAQGLEVLSETGTPIQLLAQGGPPVVTADGMVRQGDAVLGRLGIAAPTEPERLVPLQAGLFAAGDLAGMNPVATPRVQQGALEGSNVSPLREMVDLVNIARAYEANQRLIQSRDKLLERTLEAFT
jgi:flagellar basal body rod protein FlgG